MSLSDTRETHLYVILEWHELRTKIIEHVLAQLDSSEAAERLKQVPHKDMEIKIRQETEGSPAYSVEKWRAHVKITASSDI